MRKRNIFAIAIASMTLALGVGAGLKVNKVQEAKAASTVRMYVDVSSWSEGTWTDANALTYAYVAGGTTSVAWPGQQMTLSSVTGIYYLDIYDDDTTVNFLRVNPNDKTGSGVWTRVVNEWKSDISLPNDYSSKNVFKVYHSGYDDWTYAGSWDYVEPSVSDGAYLRGDWTNGWSTAGQKAMTAITTGTKYSIDNVALGAGGTVKMVTFSRGYISWAQPGTVSSTNSDKFPAAKEESMNNVTVTNAGVYTIVLQKNNDVWDYTFTGSLPAEYVAAVEFCDDFKTSMGKYCPVTGSDGNKGLAKLESEWSDFANRFNNASFANSRPYLTDANPSDATFIEFQERYDSIMGDYYSSLSSYNFLGRSYTPANTTIEMVNNQTNTVAVVVIIISTISLVALGGFFFIKRKKEN